MTEPRTNYDAPYGKLRDWSPAVMITASVCVLGVVMVWVTTPWLTGAFDGDPGPDRARRLPPVEVVAWVGEVAPDVKGVLAPVWGDPDPDRRHDDRLNVTLGLIGGRELSYYRLLLFNTAAEDRSVPLGDGAVRLRPANGRGPAASRSLAVMAARGDITVTPGVRAVLDALGAMGETVVVPAGSMVPRLVAFDRRVDLGDAAGVERADGTAFRRRPMARAELQALLYDPPDEERVKDL